MRSVQTEPTGQAMSVLGFGLIDPASYFHPMAGQMAAGLGPEPLLKGGFLHLHR